MYKASAKKQAVVEVPPMNFLMMDGSGDPNSASFRATAQALYSVAYTIKFAIKKALGTDFKVMPLEGLWWTATGELNLDDIMGDRAAWRWTLMIMQPEVVTAEWIERGIQLVKQKKNLLNLDQMRFETFCEGTAVQVLHIGPYSTELPTIAVLHDFAHQQGYQLIGKHHEIYLSDPNRAAPEKLKTILRQPVTR